MAHSFGSCLLVAIAWTVSAGFGTAEEVPTEGRHAEPKMSYDAQNPFIALPPLAWKSWSEQMGALRAAANLDSIGHANSQAALYRLRSVDQ
ncbi:hypothetical protein [Rhizobium sp. 1399]|uniref:hypothetical protein n=1 Tax=Rhizobium sp. 1399 TaxID=2817758 RepID=UPI002854E6F7|nr:hypothetical protein [Rhizobium sp. 1399]MDR6671321.1 hypothetical protein [Rhizobium sp. 1399]